MPAADFFGENEITVDNSVNIKEHIAKYIWYWPLFCFSLIVCIAACYSYLKYAVPKYNTSTFILVKAEQKANHAEDLISKALNGELKDNLENESQLLRSRRLMERVVMKNGFNQSYFIVGKFRNSDIYKQAPFHIEPQKIGDSANSIIINIEKLGNAGVLISNDTNGDKTVSTVSWDKAFTVSGSLFKISKSASSPDTEGKYIYRWDPVTKCMNGILENLSVDVPDKKASIIKLDLLTENMQRGQDILNSICKEFNLTDIEDKNVITARTISFIDDRLDIVYRELNGVEGNLESYQGNNQIVNVASQSSQSFSNQDASTKSLANINMQQGVIKMIENYFNGSNNEGKLVPSSLGINDATLSSLISKFNELQLKKERDAPLLAPGSPLLKDLNSQINDLKASILENLQNITKNLKLQEESYREKDSQYRQFLNALPHKERVMQEIKRKQSITEGLYLYLLQKREESSISASASNISIYKQIDQAVGYGPVEPNSKNLWMYSILAGLLIPAGWIMLRDVTNEKVSSRKDVTKRLKLPVLGEVGSIPGGKQQVAVMDAGVTGEQFRIIRSNLFSLQKGSHGEVVLVTSSTFGEGKSLISLNLAAVLAIPGKKVALLELDLRSPGISGSLGIANSTGLVDFISGNKKNLADIRYNISGIPTADFYPSGPVSGNPADLLLKENIGLLFKLLRQEYQYIIVDCAPTGLVSDAFILNGFSDMVLYVIRQQFTLKKQLDLVADLNSSRKLTNIGIVLNDVKTDGKNENNYGIKYNKAYGKDSRSNFWDRFIPA